MLPVISKNKPVVPCQNVQRTHVLRHARRSDSNIYGADFWGYIHSPQKQTSSLKLQDLSVFFKFRKTCWKQPVILFCQKWQSLSALIVKVVAEDKFSDGHEQVGSVAQKNAKGMKEIVQFDGQMHVKRYWKRSCTINFTWQIWLLQEWTQKCWMMIKLMAKIV
jgi:hypothetical protein